MNSHLNKTVVACVALFLMCAAPAWAAPVSLSDLGSAATIEVPAVPGPGGGMNKLERNVGGAAFADVIDDMQNQWWWIGVGGNAPVPINSLGGLVGPSVTDTNANPGNDRVRFAYGNSSVRVIVTYELQGSLPGEFSSTVRRSVVVQNMATQPAEVRLYSYSNLALTYILDGPGDGPPHWEPNSDEQAALLAPGDRIRQWDTDPLRGLISNSETAVSPMPTAIEVGLQGAVLAQVQAGTLNGQTSINPPGQQTGEELAFAFQWTRTLGSRETLVVTEDLHILPEPATGGLIAMGLALMAARTRRRSA